MIASLIIGLHLAGFISLGSAISSLYIAGCLLIIAELGVVSFGVIAFNGLLALYAGYGLQRGTDIIFGVPVGWDVLFGVAFVEIFMLVSVISIHVWLRRMRATTGTEAMIGQKATITEWDGNKGQIRFEGEMWKAKSNHDLDLQKGDEVIVDAVNRLDVTIKV